MIVSVNSTGRNSTIVEVVSRLAVAFFELATATISPPDCPSCAGYHFYDGYKTTQLIKLDKEPFGQAI